MPSLASPSSAFQCLRKWMRKKTECLSKRCCTTVILWRLRRPSSHGCDSSGVVGAPDVHEWDVLLRILGVSGGNGSFRVFSVRVRRSSVLRAVRVHPVAPPCRQTRVLRLDRALGRPPSCGARALASWTLGVVDGGSSARQRLAHFAMHVGTLCAIADLG